MNQPPIAITWGKEMIKEKGGLLAFIRHFEMCMAREDDIWLHKCKNQPKHEILDVYVIVCNQVRYKLLYAGYETEPAEIEVGDGHSWCSTDIIHWPRLLLAGPFEKAPTKIPYRGFQGFRYLDKELF